MHRHTNLPSKFVHMPSPSYKKSHHSGQVLGSQMFKFSRILVQVFSFPFASTTVHHATAKHPKEALFLHTYIHMRSVRKLPGSLYIYTQKMPLLVGPTMMYGNLRMPLNGIIYIRFTYLKILNSIRLS